MADNVKDIGEGSPENVAWKLFYYIRSLELMNDRRAVLDCYVECLDATRGARDYQARKQ